MSSSSSDENNVGNDALFVIGLHGSGDTIALFLQDWEVAKVALSCHIALDMLWQELYDVEGRRGLVRTLFFDFTIPPLDWRVTKEEVRTVHVLAWQLSFLFGLLYASWSSATSISCFEQ